MGHASNDALPRRRQSLLAFVSVMISELLVAFPFSGLFALFRTFGVVVVQKKEILKRKQSEIIFERRKSCPTGAETCAVGADPGGFGLRPHSLLESLTVNIQWENIDL